MNKDENVIPAGSLPIGGDNSIANAATEGQEPPVDQSTIPEKFQGKSQEDLVKAYQELEKDHGRLGSEVGNLRKSHELAQKQSELLLNQLNSIQQKNAQQNEASPDFEAQIADLTKKVETGDIDISEALKQTAQLTAMRAGSIAEQKINQITTQNKAQEVRDKFIKDNPDFTTLQQSGQLEAIKAENPLHDDFSAYLEFKRNETASQADAAIKAALEQGRQEGAKLAAGADAAGRVIGKTGGSPRQAVTNTQPIKEGEKISGMLGVLQGIRGG